MRGSGATIGKSIGGIFIFIEWWRIKPARIDPNPNGGRLKARTGLSEPSRAMIFFARGLLRPIAMATAAFLATRGRGELRTKKYGNESVKGVGRWVACPNIST